MAIALSNIYMVRIVEKCSFFDAFGRCFELLQGFFLSTLGLYFVTSLISFSLLGLLPMIIQGVSLFFAETLMFDVPILFYALQIFLFRCDRGFYQRILLILPVFCPSHVCPLSSRCPNRNSFLALKINFIDEGI